MYYFEELTFNISSNIFLSSIALNIFEKILPSTTAVIRGLPLWYNKSRISGIYLVRNLFKAFLEGQISEDKSIYFFACNKKPALLSVSVFFSVCRFFMSQSPIHFSKSYI